MRTFTKLYDDVMCDQDPRMNIQMKLVYSYLLRFQESAGISSVFPSNDNIMSHTGFSKSTVQRATRLLQGLGLIAKTRRFNKSNLFEIRPYSEKGVIADSESEGCQPDLSRGVTETRLEVSERPPIRLEDKIREKISLKEEGQNHASLITEGRYLNDEVAEEENDESISDRECSGDRECVSTHSEFSKHRGVSPEDTGKPSALYVVVDNIKPHMTDDDEPLEPFDDGIADCDCDDDDDDEPLAYDVGIAF